MEAYSMDLRKRVLAACDAGKGTREVARVFGVSEAWVRRLKQRRREWGRIEPLPRNSGRKPALDEAGRAHLAALVREKPDATLEELRAALPVRISIGALWSTLKKLEFSFKKSPCTRPSKSGRTSRPNGRSGIKGWPT
jgi:transposase